MGVKVAPVKSPGLTEGKCVHEATCSTSFCLSGRGVSCPLTDTPTVQHRERRCLLVLIATPGSAEALADAAFRAEVEERIAGLHRIGRPVDVAGAVGFLASPAGRRSSRARPS